MRKKIVKILILTVISSFPICGCQKAPEESSLDKEILHAKDSAEDEVIDILESDSAKSEIDRDRKEIHCLVGTEENGIKIEASAPYFPEHVYHMVLGENSSLNMNLLKDFLESDSSEIRDLSEQYMEEAAQVEAENEKSEEKVLQSAFGNETLYAVSDGKKEASFINGTGVAYEEKELYEQCSSIYKNGRETLFQEADLVNTVGNQVFPIEEAKKMLLSKLEKVQVSEIHMYEICLHESDDFLFYEMYFTPSYEGMGTTHGIGSMAYKEVFPEGTAWVCKDGIAFLRFKEGLGEVDQKEEYEKVLSWEQIEKIIEVNLKNGNIHGSSKIAMTEVEFVYYPFLSEDEKELELIPVWQMSIPLSQWLEIDNEETDGAARMICIHAVSGEIVRVE